MNFIKICVCPVTVILLYSRNLWNENGPHLTSTTCLEIRHHCLCLLSFVDRIIIVTGNHFPSFVVLSITHMDEISNLNEKFCENSPKTFQHQLLAYEFNVMDSVRQTRIQHQVSVEYEHFLVVLLVSSLGQIQPVQNY